MKVYVKLYAILVKRVSEAVLVHQDSQAFRAGSRLEIALPEGSTLDDVANHLGLPRELG